VQLIVVLGSFTTGEIARNAISTIWMMPNYTSCRSVRVGPMSNAPNSVPLAPASAMTNSRIRKLRAGRRQWRGTGEAVFGA
jgi:hypothetical protein